MKGFRPQSAPSASDKTSSSRRVYEQARRAIRAGDVNAFLDCDDDFHLLIPHAAGQYLAEDALRRLRGLARITVRDNDWDGGILDRIAAEHEVIIEAFVDGDADAAAEAMTAHLVSSVPY